MDHAGFPLGLNTNPKQIKEIIAKKNANNELLIMELNEIPFGEISFKIEDNIASFGIKICVKTLRGKGIGQALLTTLFLYLFERNISLIKCDTNLKNIGAQNFYQNKMHMRKSKTIENCWTNQIGELQSTAFFEITKDEFLSSLKD